MRFGEAFGGLFPGVRGAVLGLLLRTGVPMTGRQIHAALRDDASLWSVQQALADLADVGIVDIQTVGRAHLHSINEDHYATQPLRVLVDPFTALREVVAAVVGSRVQAVILFGSVARGTATPSSDIDLAVLAEPDWQGRVDLEDAVRCRLGNDCDVLVFTPADFSRLAGSGEEPVVKEILSDGVVLLGSARELGASVA